MHRRGLYPVPPDERTRLDRLDGYRVFGHPPAPELDRMTDLAARLFDVPICLISIIGRDTQWLASRRGLDVCDTPRAMAFCARTIMGDDPLIVLDARKDADFRDNPLVTGHPGIRFYAGAPLIVEDGVRLGALCLIDREPHARFDARQRALLAGLAALVAERLVLRRRHGIARAEAGEALADMARGAEARRLAVREVIDRIDALVRQSRMLALKGAIEAARPGRRGDGFASLARGMRTLAADAADAARSVRTLLDT